MLSTWIAALADYGAANRLIEPSDRTYVINSLLREFDEDCYEEPENVPAAELEEILGHLLDYACEKGIIPDSIAYRDLFDTRLMGVLTPRPSEVIAEFKKRCDPETRYATDYFYKLCRDSDYIRRYRIAKDVKWKTVTPYGELDITINLSKPEKDPLAIAAAKKAVQSGYPKCLLCPENEGYRGTLSHPARQNLRIIPVNICGEEWGFQYSPYVYYNEHCILLNKKHTPMVIDRNAFDKLFDFVRQFPHYFIGSNADLPIVGGSILSHEHFQGGHYTFAMETASVEKEYSIKGFEDIKAGRVKWPMSVIRLTGENPARISELADKILTSWRAYTDKDAFIFAETNGEPHNTITPIARRKGSLYELDLVLRNNITTEEHPLGVYHPHSELHHIKKENIGLIEVMGLAVLPARLKNEMDILKEVILTKGVSAVRENDAVEKHADWAEEFASRQDITADNIDSIIRDETGAVFAKVLEHAGVFKRTDEGMAAFDRFVNSL